ncbi:pentapeptide repeat-containing protein, partial [Citrobacter sp. Cpo086]|uniref:pentapeptide repeat-containing protein n=1 Tax=Citrobacter sp. Cpo086 TaxID=2985137 RepID=UPI00336A8BCB
FRHTVFRHAVFRHAVFRHAVFHHAVFCHSVGSISASNAKKHRRAQERDVYFFHCNSLFLMNLKKN